MLGKVSKENWQKKFSNRAPAFWVSYRSLNFNYSTEQ
jgi:hypothetical protein